MTTITTRYGRTWNLLDPQACNVSFWEIAEVLARIPRFNGHASWLYSVAQHSCLAHDHVCEDGDPELRLLALLHDGHEALIGDIITPVKEALCWLPGGKNVDVALEHLKVRHDMAIHVAAGLPELSHSSLTARVKQVDAELLLEEQLQLFPQERFRKPKIVLECWSEERSAREFMQRLYGNPIYQKHLAQKGELTEPQFREEMARLIRERGVSTEDAEGYAVDFLKEFLSGARCEYGSPDYKWDLNAAGDLLFSCLMECE